MGCDPSCTLLKPLCLFRLQSRKRVDLPLKITVVVGCIKAYVGGIMLLYYTVGGPERMFPEVFRRVLSH